MVKNIKVSSQQVKHIGMLEDGSYVYIIRGMPGYYKIKGYDKGSDRFIYRKLSIQENRELKK